MSLAQIRVFWLRKMSPWLRNFSLNFTFDFDCLGKLGELKAKLREAEDDMVKALAGNFDYLKILKDLEFCFDFLVNLIN